MTNVEAVAVGMVLLSTTSYAQVRPVDGYESPADKPPRSIKVLMIDSGPGWQYRHLNRLFAREKSIRLRTILQSAREPARGGHLSMVPRGR